MSRPILSALFAFLGCCTVLSHPATNAVVPAAVPQSRQVVSPTNVVVPMEAARKTPGYPFRGKLAAVDLTRGTIQIGKSTYWITASTKITKLGRAARLNEGVIGEEAVGYARKGADGRAFAASLRFGPKVELTAVPSRVGAK